MDIWLDLGSNSHCYDDCITKGCLCWHIMSHSWAGQRAGGVAKDSFPGVRGQSPIQFKGYVGSMRTMPWGQGVGDKGWMWQGRDQQIWVVIMRGSGSWHPVSGPWLSSGMLQESTAEMEEARPGGIPCADGVSAAPVHRDPNWLGHCSVWQVDPISRCPRATQGT